MFRLGVKTMEQITSEVDLLSPIVQLTCILNQFNREFVLLASIQPDAPIQFIFKWADQLYLDLNDSSLLF